ncbi:MAG: ribonuclease P protein component [Kiritimatiellia bacterium]
MREGSPRGGPSHDRRLGRTRRIRESKVFSRAMSRRGGRAGRFIVLRVSGDEGRGRLGVIAGKRTFRRSVDRVRAKRLLREAYRLNRHRFSGTNDVILIARKPILGVKRQEVEKDLLVLARKEGILKTALSAKHKTAGEGKQRC